MKVIKKSENLNGLYSKVRFSCPVCDGKVAVKESDLESVR